MQPGYEFNKDHYATVSLNKGDGERREGEKGERERKYLPRFYCRYMALVRRLVAVFSKRILSWKITNFQMFLKASIWI